MAAYTWTLQGSIPTPIDATDIIQFAGSAFGTAVFVDAYQDSTHVKTSGGTNKSSGNSPHNTKYLTSNTVSLNGAGSAAVSSISTANCPLKINFAHGSAVTVTNHVIYAYDGVSTANPPVGVTFQIAEQADTNWVNAGGSAAALAVGDRTANTSHDFFFLVSAAPASEGLKNAFRVRDELIYT